ncbi:hypothetical protein KLP28_12870 [Nocardioidaceae bacterium]|nr:hypothetical protein KLP28_12870 [Nocardioidaceae bacterium]
MISTDERVEMQKRGRREHRARWMSRVLTAGLIACAALVLVLDGLIGNEIMLIGLLVASGANVFTRRWPDWHVVARGPRMTMKRSPLPIAAATVFALSIGMAGSRIARGSDPPAEFRWTTLPTAYAPLVVILPLLWWFLRAEIVLDREHVRRRRRFSRTAVAWSEMAPLRFTPDGAVRVEPLSEASVAGGWTDDGFTVPTFDADLYPSDVRDALAHWAEHPEDRAELGTPAATARLRAT